MRRGINLIVRKNRKKYDVTNIQLNLVTEAGNYSLKLENSN